MTTLRRRLVLVFTICISVAPFPLARATQQASPKTEYFDGKVIALADVLTKHSAKLDADVNSLCLQSNDGKAYVLVKDDGSRMFFMDRSLLNRPMHLTGRLLPNSHLLQVITVQSFLQGRLHDVYYWCETCSIRATEPGDCFCCYAPFEFRETPAK